MTPSDDRNHSKAPEAAAPKARKRFRIEKLEERIAPTPHLNPQSKMVGGNGGGNNGGGSASGSSITFSGGGSYY